MQLYKENKWRRNYLISFFSLLRDYLFFLLPVKHIPPSIIRMFYGVEASFIFFVHARRPEDIYVALGFFTFLRKFLGRKKFLNSLHFFPPFVLDKVFTPSGVNGLVISSVLVPEILIYNRRLAVKEALRGIKLASKISKRGAIFGLGGLWPMLTKRGVFLKKYASLTGLHITNGHCGTLISIFLTIKKLSKISGIPLNHLKIAILGAGKMGANLARALYTKVASLALIDINEARLNRLEEELRQIVSETDIQKYNNRYDIGGVSKILSSHHIAVATTSNTRRILKPEDIPVNTIIIDDSRPEAIPRFFSSDNIFVLEGGLLKIRGVKYNYDFGFGVDENVFGCLAESYILASDRTGFIKPTLGDVDFNNFKNMLSFLDKVSVDIGDFKSSNKIIPEGNLISCLKAKTHLRSTIPFKDICWILKVEELRDIAKEEGGDKNTGKTISLLRMR